MIVVQQGTGQEVACFQAWFEFTPLSSRRFDHPKRMITLLAPMVRSGCPKPRMLRLMAHHIATGLMII